MSPDDILISRCRCILILLYFLFHSVHATGQDQVRIMTANIRFDSPDDGKDQWENRKGELIRNLLDVQPDFLGVQEGLLHQVLDMRTGMETYAFIGAGRDDGKNAGEFSALFYDSTKWTPVFSEMFWLSETPQEPSLGWDANCRRVVTWGTFRNHSGDTITVMNTHLDHMGKEARKNSIRLIMDRIGTLGKASVILMGDFNFTPDDPNYKVIATLMEDARATADHIREVYPGTYNGFLTKGDFDRRIDYVFSSTGSFHVDSYEVPDWRRKDGRQVSDHFPVIVDLSTVKR